jgi:hypothetical protein
MEWPLAPCKGDAFQWVQAPTRQQLQPEAIGVVIEVTKWLSEDYAWLLHRGTGGGMSTKAYATREDDTRNRLKGGISVACARPFASAGPTSCSTVCAAAEVEKERSAMEDDFGVKSIRPRPNAVAWRRKRTSGRP